MVMVVVWGGGGRGGRTLLDATVLFCFWAGDG